MNTPMTQEEFEGRMALHAEYLEKVNANKVTALTPAWFMHENLTNIDTEGHNFDEVSFLHCRLPMMDLRATTHTRAAGYIDRCTVAGVVSDHRPELSLNLIESRVDDVQLHHIGCLNLHIRDCLVESLAIRHSALDLNVSRTDLGRMTITECKGEGLDLSRVTGRFRLWNLKNNAFENLQFYTVECLGYFQMPTWVVNYCGDLLQIGCQQHPIEAWKNFTDDEIDFMDREALEWWKKYKEPVLAIVEANREGMLNLGTQLCSLEETERDFKQRAERFTETKKARQRAIERGEQFAALKEARQQAIEQGDV